MCGHRCPGGVVLAVIPIYGEQEHFCQILVHIEILTHDSFVLRMNRELESQYGLITLFKYVVTTQNPADMITTELTLKRILSNFEFWCAGPP